MRFKFDKKKSLALRQNPKRRLGFEEVQEVFSHPYYQDQRNDQPKQYRAIGWAKSRVYSVIYEVKKRLARRVLSLGDFVEGDTTGRKAL